MLVQEQQKQKQCTTVIELRAARDMPINQQNTNTAQMTDANRSVIPDPAVIGPCRKRPKARAECLKKIMRFHVRLSPRKE